MYQHYPDPLSITQRRKNVGLSPKSVFWTSKQLFAIHFLLATCNVCPLAIPKFFAHNMGIRLLANHSLAHVVFTKAVDDKIQGTAAKCVELASAITCRPLKTEASAIHYRISTVLSKIMTKSSFGEKSERSL